MSLFITSLKAQPTLLRRSLFTVVQQGSVAYRMKFGRSPTLLQPGLHLNIPVYHHVRDVDMREQSFFIEHIQAYTGDNVPVTIDGSLFYSVKDAYKACFNVGDYKGSVKQVGSSAIRAVIGHFAYDEIIADRNKINERMCSVIGQSIDQWGVDDLRSRSLNPVQRL
jgi:regulator of protease activity HflC (stomatin/prohibitin superfamily)